MIIYTERIDADGRKIAGALDVVDLESFADQINEYLEENPDGRITVLRVDTEGSVLPITYKRKWWKF